MPNLTSIIALLKAALVLLALTAGTPQQPQAVIIAQNAVAMADQALAQQVVAPSPLPATQGEIGTAASTTALPVPQPTPAPQFFTPVSIPVITTPTPSMSNAQIEIISPIGGKGLGREPYKSANPIVDESNYIEIGVIVYDDAGNPTENSQVTVTATDGSQSKVIDGTGTFWGKPLGDVYTKFPKGVFYYPFHYEFHQGGKHTITFTALGASAAVTIDVQ